MEVIWRQCLMLYYYAGMGLVTATNKWFTRILQMILHKNTATTIMNRKNYFEQISLLPIFNVLM